MKPWHVHFIMAAVFFAAGVGVLFVNTGISRYAGALFAVVFGARRVAVGIAERRAAQAAQAAPSDAQK
jgi:hypothetical protein